MNYDKQLETLGLIARQIITESGIDNPPRPFAPFILLGWLRDAESAYGGKLCEDPSAFINGACKRGWLIKDVAGDIILSGQLCMLLRTNWPTLLPFLHNCLERLAHVVEQQKGNIPYDMDELIEKASIGADWGTLVWSTMLSAVPGLGQTTTRSQDGKRVIWFAPEMLDAVLCMKIVDTVRPSPDHRALPLEVEPAAPPVVP